MISQLNDLNRSDCTKYGSKAALLGELFGIGLQVPKGFAISSEVFTEYLEFNRFPYKSRDYLAQNENMIAAILKGNFPERIINDLRSSFERLNSGEANKTFAVRSSALCEDSENYSMAGVFSSFVNLHSFDEIIEAVKKCYASLFSDRALSMMVYYNIPLEDLKMGVIIQEFICGIPSGVAFSADTVKMDPEVLIINAVNSICADYVDGRFPSSMYKISKSSCKPVDSLIPPNAPVLTESGILKLHKEILLIEESLGSHVDIEWTMKKSDLYILQARPITTFRSKTFPEHWFKSNDMSDTLTLTEDKALTPLQQDIKIGSHYASGRGLEYSSKGRNSRFQISSGYLYQAVDERDWDKRAKFRAWLEELFIEGKNIFQDIQLKQIITLRDELKAFLQKELDLYELKNTLYKARKLYELSVEIHISAVDGGIIPLDAFENYCRSIDGTLSKDDFYDLVYGVSKLSEERQAAINIALLVKSDPELLVLFSTYSYDEILYAHLNSTKAGQKLLKEIDEYLKDYGLITVNGQWETDSPVLFEKPWAVIGKIRACLGVDCDLFIKSREKSFANKEAVIRKMTADMKESEKEEFLKRLKGAEKAFLVNDDHCFYLDLTAAGYLRLALVKIAELFKNKGLIINIEDIDFMTFDEIISTLGLLQDNNIDFKYLNIINMRKNENKLQRRILPPAYIGNPLASTAKQGDANPERNLVAEGYSAANDDSIIIKGVSGLQKKVSGKVKVITGHGSINLQEPAVLVLKSGHSCYFLPVIDKIKGLVYDGGSPYDHPGIIARELSIPSLYNTKIATKILKDGDVVELDGINECLILKER